MERAKLLLPTIRYFGDYELLEEIARGGMGVVYKARQVSLNRIVALKMILAGTFASSSEVQRFRAEAEAAANLDHPHIVPIFEVGEHDGQQYYSMKFVEGDSLAKHPAGAARAEVAGLIEVARAVHHAHQHGVLHRDLKPSNVLVDSRGTWYVTDFGLAKRLAGAEHSLTESGQVLGTPRYMAPEQAAGRKDLTVAADVYSLGVILYERPHRQGAFAGDDILNLLRQVREAEPTRPSSIRPGLDRDLETIVLKCMEKEEANRYGSADSLADDLERWRSGEPITARPVPAWERAQKWARRRPALASLVAVSIVAALALVGVGVGLWYNERLQRALRQSRQQHAEGERQRQRAEQHERISRRYWYASDLNWAQRNQGRGQLRPAMALLDRQRPGPGQPDLRGFEWYYLCRLCRAQEAIPTTYAAEVGAVAFSPDGTKLAVSSADPFRPGGPGQVFLCDLGARRSRSLSAGFSGAVPTLAFSPDGLSLAAGTRSRGVIIWNVDTGTEKTILPTPAQGVACIAFTADGRTLAGAGYGWPTKLWDVATGRERATFAMGGTAILALAMTPDGKTVITGSEVGAIRLWDVARARLRSTLQGPAKGIHSLAVAPDGMTLAASGRTDEAVVLWDLAAGRVRTTVWNRSKGSVSSLAFSPDGRTLAGGGWTTVTLWDLATGEEQTTLRGHTSWVYGLTFSPDGQTLASGSWDKTVRRWDPAQGLERIHLGQQRWAISTVAYSPDGGFLVSADYKNIVLFDARSNREVASIPAPHWISTLAYAPDGATFATGGPVGERGDGPGTVRLWDATARALRTTLDPQLDPICVVAFSPDGQTLAIGGRASGKGVARLWDARTGRERTSLEVSSAQVESLAFSSNGQLLATAARTPGAAGEIALWDLPTGRQRATFAGRHAVAFSPDNTTLAYGGEGGVVLRDLATGREQLALGADSTALQFSPDGRTLATAGGSAGGMALWQVATGQELISFNFKYPVTSLAFSPDGTTLAVGSGSRDENEGAVLLRADRGE